MDFSVALLELADDENCLPDDPGLWMGFPSQAAPMAVAFVALEDLIYFKWKRRQEEHDGNGQQEGKERA